MATRQRRVRHSAPARQHGSIKQDWGHQYTFPQLEALWIAAGGPRSEAQTAAAVALAESGGYEKRPNASGDGGMGLWQITPAEHGSDTAIGNARQAVRKWKAAKKATGSAHGAWSNQWVAYANGSYKKFVIGSAPDKTILEKFATGPAGDAIAAGANAIQPLQALGELAIGLTELLLTPEGWRRILKVTIGSVVLIWALNQLSKSMFGVNPVGSTARTAARYTGAGAVRSAVIDKTAAATGGKVAGRIKG